MSTTRYDMKTKLLVIFTGLTAPFAFGDATEGAKAFAKVEGAEMISIEMKTFPSGEISAALLKELANYDFGPDEEKKTYKFEGFTYDLNKDGQPEYFVYSPTYSGSGGSAFMVFSKFGEAWKKIDDYQGALWILPSEKGWPRIVNVGHGGGDNYAKIRSEFKSTQYETTLIERYTDGKLATEIPKKQD
jgi:hypothetical protein